MWVLLLKWLKTLVCLDSKSSIYLCSLFFIFKLHNQATHERTVLGGMVQFMRLTVWLETLSFFRLAYCVKNVLWSTHVHLFKAQKVTIYQMSPEDVKLHSVCCTMKSHHLPINKSVQLKSDVGMMKYELWDCWGLLFFADIHHCQQNESSKYSIKT